MAWFHKTLTKMKSLIELELKKPLDKRDWTKVKSILKDHERLCSISEGDISEVRSSIQGYEKHLDNVGILVNRRRLVGLEERSVITECENAINNAKSFEDAINRLNADEKFLEES